MTRSGLSRRTHRSGHSLVVFPTIVFSPLVILSPFIFAAPVFVFAPFLYRIRQQVECVS